MAKIKICGLRREADVGYVNELLPDYTGFILTEGFRRTVDFETAAKLSEKLSNKITPVGVFVNDSLENINRFLNAGIISVVQLHGNESAEFCEKINAPVIKFFKPSMFGSIKDYSAVQYFLFDSGTGTGKTFQWSKIPTVQKPFFLAGGLDENNLKEAINRVRPYCVDMSSSVETNGVKDYDKIKRVMEIVRNE